MSDENLEVRRAAVTLAGLFAHNPHPDFEVEASARTKLATAKITKAIREALAASPTLHPAQVEYLTGLLSEPGGIE